MPPPYCVGSILLVHLPAMVRRRYRKAIGQAQRIHGRANYQVSDERIKEKNWHFRPIRRCSRSI